VIADPVRLRLLSLLASKPEGETCVCDLVESLGLTQPMVSHHLRMLYEAGLVTRTRLCAWNCYRRVAQRLQILSDAVGVPTISLAVG